MEVSCQLHPPAALLLGERASGTQWIGVWIGLRAELDAVEEKISYLFLVSNLDSRVVQLVA
jgi:hypothetical protein